MRRGISIIAEAGVNHNGDVGLAKEMIHAAAEAGADYIKFQTFVPELLVSKSAKKAKYQQSNTGGDDSQLTMLNKLVLPHSAYSDLLSASRDCGVKFLSTPFDNKSIDFLSGFGMDFWKLPSGELTNLPYLRKIASMHSPVVLSTGMSNLREVDWALKILLANGVPSLEHITVLHCNTQYPTPMSDVNLRAMLEIRDAFGVKVGYSDHTLGIEIPIAAVAMGACIVEKHFTLDRSMIGPDHQASLEPSEFRSMVTAIRNVEAAMGNGEKTVTESERDNIAVARKSIVAACSIKEGEILSESNLTVKRPGTGVSPMRWDEVIGLKAKRDFSEDELIEL